MKLLQKFIRRTLFGPALNDWVIAIKQKWALYKWEAQGKPVPPPHIVKQLTIMDYANKYDLKIFVETGTYFGDMVEAMKPYFNQIYSIELSEDLYEKARIRFAGEDKIKIICGDSGVELCKVIDSLHQSALFWLDGHYSAGVTAKGDKNTPIYEELAQIYDSENRDHVVIIDDARCFGKDKSYPTVEEIGEYVKSRRNKVFIEIKNDSIIITPY